MQYLSGSDLLNNIPYFDFKSEDLISADSYNEEELLKNFNSIEKIGQELLIKCAIHIAIIGAGNRTYGSIRIGNDIVEIKTIFTKYKIAHNQNINEKYAKNTLSARRLIRLLRFHIQKFILLNKRPSYLWTKYSDRDNNMISICFPGGEHLIETQEQAAYLMNTYKNLDLALGTGFYKRLERVFIARGLIKPTTLLQTVSVTVPTPIKKQ